MSELLMFDDPHETETMYDWVKDIAITAKVLSEHDNASQPFHIPRNSDSKYLSKISKYIFQIQNGTFLKNNRFSEIFLGHTDIHILKKLHGTTENIIRISIQCAINKYLLARNNPNDYDFIGRDRRINIGTFIYEFNEKINVLGISHFIKYYSLDLKTKNNSEAPERMLSTIYKKDLSEMYRKVYNHYVNFSDEETVRMVKSILSLCRWWKRNESRLFSVYRGKLKILFPKGMITFIEHYLGMYVAEHHFIHPIALFPGKKHWDSFCNWMFNGYQIDLEVEEKTMNNKKNKISAEEIAKRMEAD